MSAGRLILWRHGQTNFNLEQRIQGARDVELNGGGREQARIVAPYIAAMRPAKIISSPLSRARETAEEAAALLGLEVHICAGLSERDFGAFEGLNREELLSQYPVEYRAWKAGEVPTELGIEPRQSVGARAVAAIEEAAEPMDEAESLLVVSHGAALSCVMATLLGHNPDEWGGIAGLDNCHWALLRRSSRPPGWRMLAHNRIVPTEREGELGVQGIGSIES